MGKITFGSLVSEARGKIGSQVFKRNKYGPYVQEWTAPLNTPSPARNAAKALMTELSEYFTNSLTDAQRAAWNAYGEGRLRFDRLHTEYALTGANAFMATNIPLLLIGSAQLDSPPLSDNVQLPGALGVTAFGGLVPALGVTPAAAPDPDHGVLIWATPPLSPGRNYFYRHMRQIAAFTAGTPPPYDFTTQFLDRYSTLFEGQKVGIGLEFINKNNGQRSRKSTFLATAESSPDIDMLLRRTIAVPHADILTWPTTPVEIVPAAGPGKIIIPIVIIYRSSLTVAYTNVRDLVQFTLPPWNFPELADTSVGNVDCDQMFTAIGTQNIAAAAGLARPDTVTNRLLGSYIGNELVTPLQNQPLLQGVYNGYLPDGDDGGDFTGGDPANTFQVTIFYSILDV